MKQLPAPIALLARMDPPSASMRRRAMDRPSPTPSLMARKASAVRKKGVKMWGRSASAIPCPWSATPSQPTTNWPWAAVPSAGVASGYPPRAPPCRHRVRRAVRTMCLPSPQPRQPCRCRRWSHRWTLPVGQHPVARSLNPGQVPSTVNRASGSSPSSSRSAVGTWPAPWPKRKRKWSHL